MLLRALRACLVIVLLIPAVVTAATLEYKVRGINGEPRANVKAFLGAPPQTDQGRLNFVISAKGKVRDALKALGYYTPDVIIDVERTDPVWMLTVKVELGEPVRIRDIDIEILGAAADDDNMTALLTNNDLVVGEPLHHGEFERFRRLLQSRGQQRGYLDGDMTRSRVEVNVNAGTADIFLTYNSGQRFRFGELEYDHSLLDPEIMDSLLVFQPGEYFDQPKLRRFQSNLQRTNYFSSVIVQPERERAVADVVPIVVRLDAAKRHSFDVGLGYSTDTEERVSMTWRTPKINRYGHSQVTRIEYSPVNPSGRFTYSIPMSNPLTDVVQLWARLEENEFGDLDSHQVEAGVRRETKLDNWVYAYSLRGLRESWDNYHSDLTNDYTLLGGSMSSRKSSGSTVDPSHGFNQIYTLEGGSQHAGSDIDLLRMTAELNYIATPWPRQRVVTRAQIGAVEVGSGDRKNLAPSLSFFAGGSQSIRGYAYQSIGHEEYVKQSDGSVKRLVVGGDRLAIASAEYQYYFTDTWRGALFVDAGDAFDQGDFDAKVGAGFGVHYITPVGAVRVEVANSVSDEDPSWYFHLTIGAEF